jgi:hypothetical protein
MLNAILRSSPEVPFLRGRGSITDLSPREIDRLLSTALALRDAGQQNILAGKSGAVS